MKTVSIVPKVETTLKNEEYNHVFVVVESICRHTVIESYFVLLKGQTTMEEQSLCPHLGCDGGV